MFRVGTYKSAVEPFIRDDMSPAAREADSRWIGELWQNYLDTVAANRQIPAQQVFPGAQAMLDGRTECDEMPHSDTLRIMECMDSLRADWGLKYPFEA